MTPAARIVSRTASLDCLSMFSLGARLFNSDLRLKFRMFFRPGNRMCAAAHSYADGWFIFAQSVQLSPLFVTLSETILWTSGTQIGNKAACFHEDPVQECKMGADTVRFGGM